MLSDLLNTLKFEGYESIDLQAGEQDSSTFISMKDSSKLMLWLYVSAVNATTDYFDVLHLLQAKDTSGTAVKDLSVAFTAAQLKLGESAVVGDKYALEVNVGQLDTENDFFFVGVRFALTADGGTNTGILIWLSDPNLSIKGHNATKVAWSTKDVVSAP